MVRDQRDQLLDRDIVVVPQLDPKRLTCLQCNRLWDSKRVFAVELSMEDVAALRDCRQD